MPHSCVSFWMAANATTTDRTSGPKTTLTRRCQVGEAEDYAKHDQSVRGLERPEWCSIGVAYDEQDSRLRDRVFACLDSYAFLKNSRNPRIPVHPGEIASPLPCSPI